MSGSSIRNCVQSRFRSATVYSRSSFRSMNLMVLTSFLIWEPVAPGEGSQQEPSTGTARRRYRVRQRMVKYLPLALISKLRLPPLPQTRVIFSMSSSLQVFILGCFRSQRRAIDL